jgi:hypothetical protein
MEESEQDDAAPPLLPGFADPPESLVSSIAGSEPLEESECLGAVPVHPRSWLFPFLAARPDAGLGPEESEASAEVVIPEHPMDSPSSPTAAISIDSAHGRPNSTAIKDQVPMSVRDFRDNDSFLDWETENAFLDSLVANAADDEEPHQSDSRDVIQLSPRPLADDQAARNEDATDPSQQEDLGISPVDVDQLPVHPDAALTAGEREAGASIPMQLECGEQDPAPLGEPSEARAPGHDELELSPTDLHVTEARSIAEPSPVRRPRSPRRNGRPTASGSDLGYSDAHLSRMVTRMLSTKELPDADAIPAVRHWILNELRAAVVSSRYRYGVQLESANLMLDQLESATENALQYECRRKSVEEKLVSWQARYKETQKSWKAKIAD